MATVPPPEVEAPTSPPKPPEPPKVIEEKPLMHPVSPRPVVEPQLGSQSSDLRAQIGNGEPARSQQMQGLDAFLRAKGIPYETLSPEVQKELDALRTEDNPQTFTKRLEDTLQRVETDMEDKLNSEQKAQFKAIREAIDTGTLKPEVVFDSLKKQVADVAPTLPPGEQKEANEAIEALASQLQDVHEGKPASLPKAKKTLEKLMGVFKMIGLIFGAVVGMWLLKGMMGGGGRGGQH